MKTNQKFTVLRLLVLGLLVAGFSARPASAQTLKGTFTLPSETHWGIAMLPAGDYSFTLDHDFSGSKFTISQGRQHVAQIPTRGLDYIKSGRSEMVLENGDVRKLSLPQIGMAFEYPANNSRHRAAPQVARVVIPVAMAGAGR